ncbi:MAG: gliding motility-associated C-terminal domain-containing protein [Bacteroidales bacterium]|nr:gliding motility-associated C-terminal domain-containing protein [Bacteroidales bacterium]
MNIDKLFKDNLANAKTPLKENLWQQIESNINSTPTISSQQSFWQNLSLGMKTATVIGSVAVISTIVAIIVNVINPTPESNTIASTLSTSTNLKENDTTTYDSTTTFPFDTEKKENIVAKQDNSTISSMENAPTMQTQNNTANNDTYIFNDNNNVSTQPNILPIEKSLPVENKKQVEKDTTHQYKSTTEENKAIAENKSENQSQHTINTNAKEEVKINIRIPNFMSPNGDGINDCFEIKNIENFSDNMLIIKDRSGKTIYTARYYDNQFCGENIPDGVYYYILQIRVNHQTRAFYGNLTILRR